jgi:hypothetical protein
VFDVPQIADGARMAVAADHHLATLVPGDDRIQAVEQGRQLAHQGFVARGQPLVEDFARLGGIANVADVTVIDALAQPTAGRLLEAVAARHQPLAIDVHGQLPAAEEDVAEAAVGADDLVQVVAHLGGLVGSGLAEPAMDGALVGEAAAGAGLQGGVGAEPGVARADAPQAAGQANQDSGETVAGPVGGGPARGVAQGELVPSAGQLEGVGLTQQALGEDDAEAAADGWQSRRGERKLHRWLLFG